MISALYAEILEKRIKRWNFLGGIRIPFKERKQVRPERKEEKMDRICEEGNIQISGSKMDYIVFGRGGRNLIILPALSFRPVCGLRDVLARKYQQLSGDWRVYVLDAREDLPENCTVHDLAEDAAEAMRKLGIMKADVLGISLGGMMAQSLAWNNPELVHSLVLTVTLSRSNETLIRAAGRWEESAASGDYERVAMDMLENVYSADFVTRYGKVFPFTAHLNPLRKTQQFVRLAGSCCTFDLYEAFPQLQCPVLVIGGKHDRIVTGEASIEMAKRRGCQLYMYENLGHSVAEEGTDFVRRVHDFLKQI